VSFFVSDALKGRVTENDLLEDSKTYIDEEEDNSVLVVTIKTADEVLHEFEFVKLDKKEHNAVLSIEIPITYKYMHQIIGSHVEINLKNNLSSIFQSNTTIDNIELVKQNERSCYLLKIVIGA